MPLRNRPQRTPAALAANRANAQKSTGPRTPEGKQRSLNNLKRYFGRLLGVPEALALDQEPGAAIHLYHELIAPYEPAPALLAMHFRDLARLQLELQAWEGIRDAEMKNRAEQTMLEQHRRGLKMDRELRATLSEIFDTGLCRMDDSCGKFNAQCEALWTIRELVKIGNFADLKVPLARLYGVKMEADTDCGRMLCACAERLMPPEQEVTREPAPAWPLAQPYPRPKESVPQQREPSEQVRQPVQTAEQAGESTEGTDTSRQEDLKDLIDLVRAEERKVMAAWELALYEKQMTTAASQARLAPTRDDHWMNRQGDRLRQAIDRKMRLTPVLLKAAGLAHATKPTSRRKQQKHAKKHPHPQSQNVKSNQQHRPRSGGYIQSQNVL
jgi:hypothetical protein